MPTNFINLNYVKMFNPKAILLLLCICACFAAFSQSSIQVKGTVVDEKNVPIADATIQVKNKNTGVISDSAGKFSISVADKNAVLVITHVGFKLKEVAVPESSEITVQLIGENSTLSEVVVIGYGTQRKRR